MTFFDESTAEYYKVANATLGRPGGSTVFTSEKNSALVTNGSNAARYTGMAPSVQRAYVNGESIYGVNFPTDALEVRAPTVADAGGFPEGSFLFRLGPGGEQIPIRSF